MLILFSATHSKIWNLHFFFQKSYRQNLEGIKIGPSATWAYISNLIFSIAVIIMKQKSSRLLKLILSSVRMLLNIIFRC